MLTRRQILLTSATAASFLSLGSASTHALSTEPMPPAEARAMTLACRAATSHDEMVAEMRRMLDAEVSQGLRPADYRQMAACPFCRCGLSVTSDRAF